MNVFEDLIVELKEQHLLEETVFDFDQPISLVSVDVDEGDEFESSDSRTSGRRAPSESAWNVSTGSYSAASQTEGVKKRVNEQIVSLQMVEHVLTGVERNLLRKEPERFDELQVKKALHRFVQAAKEPESDEYFEAESKLLLEVEAWMRALTARDKGIPVAAVRRYCETAQPPLSPLALFALVRFYRLTEPTEQTVRKFDFVVSRLFSKIEDGGHRSLICSRDEIVGHLKKRYSDWSVAPPRPSVADASEKLVDANDFNDFTTEAENSESFEAMNDSKFFDRVFQTKSRAGEAYLVPQTTAAAIECNIRVANRMTEFLQNERRTLGGPEKVLEKYAKVDQFLVSDAVGRSFSFKQALDYDIGPDVFDLVEELAKPQNVEPARPVRKERTYSRPYEANKRSTSIFGLNRWLVIVCVLMLSISGGFYLWGDNLFEDSGSVVVAKTLDLQETDLREYVKLSKISSDMLYVVTTPDFEGLSRERQEEYLRKLQSAGVNKGYRKVTLMDGNGKEIAYASTERIQFNDDIPASQSQ